MIRTRAVAMACFAFVSLFTGCDRTLDTVAPNKAQMSPAELDIASQDVLPGRVRPEEAHFAELSKSVPSSAGYYLDRDGVVTVAVRDSSHFASVRAAFRRAAPQYLAQAKGGQVRIAKVDFSFGQLAKWRDLVFDRVFSQIAGVVSLDLDEVANRVVIGVDGGQGRDLQERVAKAVKDLGIPAEAAIVRVESAVNWTANNLTGSPSTILSVPHLQTGPWASLVGGIQIDMAATDPDGPSGGAGAPCSVGFTAWYTPVSGPSYRAIVSASHCTAQWGAFNGTAFSLGGVLAGLESYDAPSYSCGVHNCRASDAALFQINTTTPYELGLIARTMGPSSLLQDTQNPWFIVRGTTSLLAGASYSKMGRTSGWTSGVVMYTCVDHQFGGALGSTVNAKVARCQDSGTALSSGGDSGGSVFAQVGAYDALLLGTTVGNKTIFHSTVHVWSPFTRIASDIPGTLTVSRPSTLASPGIVGTTTGAGSSYAYLSWPAVPGASEYEVYAQDYAQSCDPYWGCSLTPTNAYRITTTNTLHVDTRPIFSSVIPPGSPGTYFTSFVVTARNIGAGNYSPYSTEVRVAH